MSTSIKVKFRLSTIADHEGTIYYQIIHNRVVRQLATDYKIFPSEWDYKRSAIVFAANSERKQLLQSMRSRIRWDVERLTKISNRLEAEGVEFSADDIIDEFNRYAYVIRRTPQLGIRRKSKGHPIERHKRKYGARI